MQVNLRTLLVVPLLLLLLVVWLLLWVVVRDGQERAVDGLLDELVDQVSDQIIDNMEDYLSGAHRMLEPLAEDLENGALSVTDHAVLLKRLRRLALFNPRLKTFGFGAADGHYVAYSGIVSPALSFNGSTLSALDDHGQVTRVIRDDIHFDARKRPWFHSALQPGVRWSGLYPWVIGVDQQQEPAVGAQLNRQLGLSAVRAVWRDGELLGVLENAITLSELTGFLAQLHIGTEGSAFIIDADGHLLGDSHAHAPLREGVSGQQRVPADLSESPRLAAALRYLLENDSGEGDINFTFQGERHHLRSTRFGGQHGLDWRVVVVIPERDFTQVLEQSERNTLMFALLCLILVGLIGFLLSERLARPIERLVSAANALAQGRWPDEPLACRIREVNELGERFSQMSRRLRELFNDMEQQVEARTSELLESRRLLTTLISNLPGTAYRCANDENWSMQFLSAGCLELTGYQPEALIDNRDLSYADLIYEEDREQVWESVQAAVEKHEAFRLTYRIRHHDGSVRWVMEQGRGVFDSAGELLALEGLFSDISDLKYSEQALQLAKQEAEEANLAKSRFLANVSHEIRTPLHAILGFAELLLEKQQIEGGRKQLQAIQTSGETLLGIIDDILDLSRIEAGKLLLDPHPFSISRLFSDMQSLFADQLDRSGLRLVVELPESPEEMLLMDAARLRQILINLIGNAIKFSEQGDIVCRINLADSAQDAGKRTLTIRVCDHGIGIPVAQQQRIFQPFERGEDAEVQGKCGTGLGLAIAARLAEQLGGELNVASTPGNGACFTLYFPAVPKGEAEESSSSTELPTSLPAAKVIVADDLELNRIVLCSFLSEQPFTLYEASDGWEVVELAKSHHPDLILMDIRMPGLSGLEAARLLRLSPETADIPIIAITADAMKEEREQITQDCDGYLAKPVSKQKLLATIAPYLSPRS